MDTDTEMDTETTKSEVSSIIKIIFEVPLLRSLRVSKYENLRGKDTVKFTLFALSSALEASSVNISLVTKSASIEVSHSNQNLINAILQVINQFQK